MLLLRLFHTYLIVARCDRNRFWRAREAGPVRAGRARGGFARMAHDDTEEFMPIRNWDHIEFYVGNARQAAHYYATTFGFVPTAYAGLETGVRDRASYVLEQGKIRLVLTSALLPGSPIGEHVFAHGDGVKDIALEVPDAEKAY